MTSSLHVVRSGTGPVLLLVHGSATDHGTWSIQLASPLKERLCMVAYDRKGPSRPFWRGEAPPFNPAARGLARPPIVDEFSIEGHAEDAAELLREAGAAGEGGPAWICGSSFGAVVALEVMRRYPELLRGAILIEPPIAASDAAHPPAGDFLASLDHTAATEGPEAAAEKFLREVLGAAAFERIPRAFRARSMSMWPQIRADSEALSRYAPRYGELAEVRVPALLLGGERSASYFRPTLEALAGALPAARLEIVKGAGHMLHAEAPRRFTELVLSLIEG